MPLEEVLETSFLVFALKLLIFLKWLMPEMLWSSGAKCAQKGGKLSCRFLKSGRDAVAHLSGEGFLLALAVEMSSSGSRTILDPGKDMREAQRTLSHEIHRVLAPTGVSCPHGSAICRVLAPTWILFIYRPYKQGPSTHRGLVPTRFWLPKGHGIHGTQCSGTQPLLGTPRGFWCWFPECLVPLDSDIQEIFAEGSCCSEILGSCSENESR